MIARLEKPITMAKPLPGIIRIFIRIPIIAIRARIFSAFFISLGL
jgi:hypothetical protein